MGCRGFRGVQPLTPPSPAPTPLSAPPASPNYSDTPLTHIISDIAPLLADMLTSLIQLKIPLADFMHDGKEHSIILVQELFFILVLIQKSFLLLFSSH